MRGWAVTRVNDLNRPAGPTRLYAREEGAVRARLLDAEQRRAYCIDVPLEMK